MADSEQNKVFVGGISWDTTEDVLKSHFERYGDVLKSVIGRDRSNGSPRGFAFVTFLDSSSLDRALLDSHHQILNRTVDVKRAIPRSEQHRRHYFTRTNNSRNNDQFKTKKIFVGGLSASLTEEEFRAYFEKFGRITDVVVMHDNMTHRPRGFGFITFESEDSVEEVMQNNFHDLPGKPVEVKRAVPKDGINSNRTLVDETVPDYQHNSGYSTSYNNTAFGGYFPSGYGAIPGYPYGYPSGPGGYGYGIAPLIPRSPWGPAMVGVRGGVLPYVRPAPPVYPPYFNGGQIGVTVSANGYGMMLGTGFEGKSDQFHIGDAHNAADSRPHQTPGKNVHANSFSYSRGIGAAAASKQSQRVNGKSYPDSNSS